MTTRHRKCEGRKYSLGWKHETRNSANNIKLTAEIQMVITQGDYENNNDSGLISYL